MGKQNPNPKSKPTDRIDCEFCNNKIMRHLLNSHQLQKSACINKQVEKLGHPAYVGIYKLKRVGKKNMLTLDLEKSYLPDIN